MKKALLGVLILCLLPACKPRYSTLSEDSGPSDYELLSFQLNWYRSYADKIGTFVNSHPIYRTVKQMYDHYQRNTDVRSYTLKMETIGFFANEALKNEFQNFVMSEEKDESSCKSYIEEMKQLQAKAGLPELKPIEPEGKVINNNVYCPDAQMPDIEFSKLLQMAYLDNNLAPQCIDGETGSRQYEVCFSFETCQVAIDSLTNFVKTGQKERFLGSLGQVKKLYTDLQQDIECLTDSYKKQVVAGVMQNRMLQLDFYRTVQLTRFRNPSLNVGEGQLRAQLETAVKNFERNFQHGIDPLRMRMVIVAGLKADEALRPIIDPEFDPHEHPEDKLGDFMKGDVESKQGLVETAEATTTQPAQGTPQSDDATATESDVAAEVSAADAAIAVEIDPNLVDGIRAKVDRLALDAASAHASNMAMLYYLSPKRQDTSDIREWMEDLERQVYGWVQWHAQYQGGGGVRPASVKNISPGLAFMMMREFVEHEMFLPFRSDYLRLMRRFVDQFVYFSDQKREATNNRKREGSTLVATLEKTRDQYDAAIIQSTGTLGANGRQMVTKERDLAAGFPGTFESLYSLVQGYNKEFLEFQTKMESYNTAIEEIKDQKILENTIKDIGFDKSLKDYLKSHLEVACMNYAVGDLPPAFYDTKINAPPIDCVKWVYSTMNLWATGEFNIDKGFTGQVDLSRVCAKPGESSWVVKRGDLLQLINDGEATLECTKATVKARQEAITQGSMLLFMPFMGFAGGLATRFIIARFSSMVAARYVASRGFTGLSATLVREMFKRRMAHLSSTYLGRFAMTGVQSFLSATFFEFGLRAFYATAGWGPFYDKNKGFWADVGGSIMLQTFIFGGFSFAHGAAHKASAMIMRAKIPMGAFGRQFVGRGIPFMATTAFFAETENILYGIDKGVELVSGQDPGLFDDENHEHKHWLYRYTHAALMTASFKAFNLTSRIIVPRVAYAVKGRDGLKKLLEFRNKGYELVPRSELKNIERMSREMEVKAREQQVSRIGRMPSKLASLFSLKFSRKPAPEGAPTAIETSQPHIVEGGRWGLTTKSPEDMLSAYIMADGHYLFGIPREQQYRVMGMERIYEISRNAPFDPNSKGLDPRVMRMVENYQAKVDGSFTRVLERNYGRFKRRLQRYGQKAEQLPNEQERLAEVQKVKLLLEQADVIYQKMADPAQRVEYYKELGRLQQWVNHHADQKQREWVDQQKEAERQKREQERQGRNFPPQQ